MRVVLDSNVLIAAFASRGLCEAVYQVCLARREIVVSEEMLVEVGRNLRAKLKLGSARASQIVSFIRRNAQIVKPERVPAGACRHADDLSVLGALSAGKADCLVTGDQDLLVLKQYAGIPILSPRGFYERLR